MSDSHLLNWIEASTLLVITLVGAISTSAVTLYRLDSVEDKVDNLVNSIQTVNIIQQEIKTIKEREEQTGKIFLKFSDSVDRLSLTLVKLETKVTMMEKKENGR